MTQNNLKHILNKSLKRKKFDIIMENYMIFWGGFPFNSKMYFKFYL